VRIERPRYFKILFFSDTTPAIERANVTLLDRHRVCPFEVSFLPWPLPLPMPRFKSPGACRPLSGFLHNFPYLFSLLSFPPPLRLFPRLAPTRYPHTHRFRTSGSLVLFFLMAKEGQVPLKGSSFSSLVVPCTCPESPSPNPEVYHDFHLSSGPRWFMDPPPACPFAWWRLFSRTLVPVHFP